MFKSSFLKQKYSMFYPDVSCVRGFKCFTSYLPMSHSACSVELWRPHSHSGYKKKLGVAEKEDKAVQNYGMNALFCDLFSYANL